MAAVVYKPLRGQQQTGKGQRERLILTVLLLVLWPFLLGLQPLTLEERPHQALTGHLAYFEEQGSPLTLSQVTDPKRSGDWQALPRSGANFGYDRGGVWYHFVLSNKRQQELTRLLVLNYPLLDDILFYRLDAEGEILESHHTGDSQPHASRAVPHRIFAFPLTLPPGATEEVYLRIQTSGSHQVPLQLWQPQAFQKASDQEAVGRGMFYGMLLLMVIFNLFLFSSLRERSFLYYVLSMASLLLLMTGLHGIAFQYLFPRAPALHEQMILSSAPLVLVFFCLFADQFLKLEKSLPAGHRVMQLLVALSLLAMVASLALPYGLVTRVTVWLSLPVLIAMLTVALLIWRQGDASGRYFVTAWLALLLGGVVWLGRLLGVVPGNLLTEYAIEIGAVSQGVLLSFALGDRFNREREGRLEEQRARIEALRQSELAEQRMLDSLSHHGLTGLPNRAMLESRLNEELARVSEAGKGELALLLLHFRGFDDINKTLGHENADHVLCQLSARLNEMALKLPDRVMIEERLQDHFAAAHVEGITFACAFRALTRPGLNGQINRLVRSLREPVAFRGLSLDIGLVGGCAIYPDDSKTVTSLLRHAFIAFDQASSEANHVAFYRPEINPYSERRLTLMTALRSAINDNDLSLYYQPQLEVNPRGVCGFEVLLRWEHSEYGFIPPDEFISMAEQTGLMGPVTDWVLEHALDFARTRREAGTPISISVNISALNLQQSNFAADVVAKVTQLGMAPSDLTLEVTETATMVDPKAALVVLRELAEAGIRLAIDDFGTGYSSLSYIRKLPVHEIKIDRSFVMEMNDNWDDATIVRTTINMCHDLGFVVVAEGVETAGAQSLLQAMGCNRLQGYYLGRPMPGDEVAGWLERFSQGQGEGAGD